MKGRFFTNHTMTGKVLDAITMKKNRCFGKETPSKKNGKRLNKSTNMYTCLAFGRIVLSILTHYF